ncbi:MAG TPA: NAD+ synthase [Patescibacteria group bacterium]|nr:NAD+ synthase [Patescibacteria group bacterium]
MFDVDYQQKITEIAKWIATTVHGARFLRAVVAVSGGIDSAVVLGLAAKGLGSSNVFAFSLPYGSMGKEHVRDAKRVILNAAIPQKNIFTIDIKKSVDGIIKNQMELRSLEQDFSSVRVRTGNIMARVRMIFLYDFARSHNALVIGTENKSEYYLGYFTRFGDEASDVEPIRNLYKTQVWEMGRALKIPEKIIQKAPTAGLWENQTDAGELGFSYNDADKILYYALEKKLPVMAIAAKGFPKNLVKKVLMHVRSQEFKHHLPYISE